MFGYWEVVSCPRSARAEIEGKKNGIQTDGLLFVYVVTLLQMLPVRSFVMIVSFETILQEEHLMAVKGLRGPQMIKVSAMAEVPVNELTAEASWGNDCIIASRRMESRKQ